MGADSSTVRKGTLSIGQKLKIMMIRRGLTYSDLSQMSGYTISCITYIFSGETKPKEQTLQDLLDSLMRVESIRYTEEGYRAIRKKLIGNIAQRNFARFAKIDWRLAKKVWHGVPLNDKQYRKVYVAAREICIVGGKGRAA